MLGMVLMPKKSLGVAVVTSNLKMVVGLHCNTYYLALFNFFTTFCYNLTGVGVRR